MVDVHNRFVIVVCYCHYTLNDYCAILSCRISFIVFGFCAVYCGSACFFCLNIVFLGFMLEVLDLDAFGRGVVRDAGQVVFVEGALPGELVRYEPFSVKRRFIEARVVELGRVSSDRVPPKCEFYEACGGCALQHLAVEKQREAKFLRWQNALMRAVGVLPHVLFAPVAVSAWHYRTRSRLALSYKGDKVRLGYYARHSNDVVDVDFCPILSEPLSRIFSPLRALLQDILPLRVRGVSVHQGEGGCVLDLRADAPLPQALLRDWARAFSWQVLVNGREVFARDVGDFLYYSLPDFDVRIRFSPDDFTQVNPLLNRLLVSIVMDRVRFFAPNEAVDFFSGLGNFSLPLARLGMDVLALEGVHEMVSVLKEQANAHGLNVHAKRADLFKVHIKDMKFWQKKPFWLLDPPRAGAKELLQALSPKSALRDVVYVSCDSATFVRDARILLDKGFEMVYGGVLDMFTHTAHVESVVHFRKV